MSFFKDALNFEKFITPSIVRVIYLICIVLVEIVGIVMLLGGVFGHNAGSMVLVGLLYMILGPIFIRIYAELILLFFRVYDKLNEISNKLPDKVETLTTQQPEASEE